VIFTTIFLFKQFLIFINVSRFRLFWYFPSGFNLAFYHEGLSDATHVPRVPFLVQKKFSSNFCRLHICLPTARRPHIRTCQLYQPNFRARWNSPDRG
jgi:hypothetical protein